MKLTARRILTAAAILCLTTPAAALLIDLKTPSVAHSAGYSQEAAAAVRQALTRKDAKFLGGFGLNSWTTLRYAGETRALNLFLDDLAKCPGVTVSVSFRRLNDELDWRVGHSAYENRFQVEVNLNSKKIKVDEVVIPPAKGPAIQPN